MLTETELLNFVRQNVEMGVDGIKLVIDDIDDDGFISELHHELSEYDRIYNAADSLLEEIGGEKQDVKAAAKIAAHLSGKMKSMSGSTSKIAESMIQGSTMGTTKLIQHINDYSGDEKALKIAEDLRKTEENNIENLKKFL